MIFENAMESTAPLAGIGLRCLAHPVRWKPGRRGPGMTLIEVLVALTFMGVVTVGITALAITIVNGNAKSRAITIAVHLAQERLEAIRNTAYGSILPGNYPPDSPQAGFQRTTAVEVDTPITGVKRIIVVVSGGGGTAQEEMLVTQ